MVQSLDGYLWFGTYAGVARFDGMGFQVFTPGNTPGLPSAGIVNAHRDRTGRIWFSTYRGVASLHGGVWTRHGSDEGWTTDYARSFAEAPDGTLYVTGFDGKVLRRVRGRFEELPGVPDAREGGMGHCDGSGRLWLAKDRFIGFWHEGRWSRVEGIFGRAGAGDGSDVWDGVGGGPASDGNFWVVWRNKLVKLGPAGVLLRVTLDQPVDSFWSLREDRHGNVWVTSQKRGLFHVQVTGAGDRRDEAMGHVTVLGGAAGQGFQSTTFVAEDDEGNVWMGTPVTGISRWRPRVVGVVGAEEGEGLAAANFRSLSLDAQGRLWAMSYGGGAFRCDAPATPDRFFRPWGGGGTTESEAVLADRSGGVWFTRLGLGSPVMRLEGGEPRVAYSDAGPKRSRMSLHEDSNGVLWVGGPEEMLSHQDGRWSRHPLPGVIAFAEDTAAGVFWAGGNRGLFRREGDAFVEVKDPRGEGFASVNSLHFVPGKGLWVAARGQGLLLRRPDGSVARVGVAQGLPFAELALVYSDGSGLLWLGGEKGIACVQEDDVLQVASGAAPRIQARLFDMQDGMPRNCHLLYARQPAVARTADGRLWFPTSAGIVHVAPGDLRRDPRPPRVLPAMVSHVDEHGRSFQRPWDFGQAIDFPPGTRSIQVDFAALSFAAPQRVITEVRLRQGDRVVATRTGKARSVTWDLLPPGRYAFDIAAANESGVWTSPSEPVHFHLRPHLWQTGGFRWATMLGVLGIILGGAIHRIRHLRLAARLAAAERERQAAHDRAIAAEVLRHSEARRQKAEAEAEARRQREAIIRDLHDGIGGLASNLKMTVSMALEAEDSQRQRGLLRAVDSLVDETLVEVRELMDAMEPESIRLEAMLEAIRRYGRRVLGPHGIQLEVTHEQSQVAARRASSFSAALLRIVQEALANVVKHAQAKRVLVHVALSDAALRLVIEDDGMGFPVNRRPGRGLHGMRRRAEQQGGSMEIHSHPGVRLTFHFPAGDDLGDPPSPPPAQVVESPP